MKGVEKNMGMEFGSSSQPASSVGPLGSPRVDAGHDGHDPEPRTERRGRRRTGQENRIIARFAWDSYRRFVQMYGDVVLDMKPQSKEDVDPFEEIIDAIKEEKKVKNDTELTTDDLKELVVALQGRRSRKTRARTSRPIRGNSSGVPSAPYSAAG